MPDRYAPPSDFLKAIAGGDAPLSGNEFADHNLRHLIKATQDEDPANRDWAAFLLASSDVDTPEVRAALNVCARDASEYVRAEAILGIALRAPEAALPLVHRELLGVEVAVAVFEAAALCAHPSLLDPLAHWQEPCGDEVVDDAVRVAIAECGKGV